MKIPNLKIAESPESFWINVEALDVQSGTNRQGEEYESTYVQGRMMLRGQERTRNVKLNYYSDEYIFDNSLDYNSLVGRRLKFEKVTGQKFDYLKVVAISLSGDSEE